MLTYQQPRKRVTEIKFFVRQNLTFGLVKVDKYYMLSADQKLLIQTLH